MVHGAGQREVRVRGRDLAWIKIHEYETSLEYLSSDIFNELANGNHSLKKSRETNYGDLTELAKVKLVERENPSVALGWDEKVRIKEVGAIIIPSK